MPNPTDTTGGTADQPGDPDDHLVADLRRLASRRDGVPAEVLASAKGTFTWRTIDADLAQLTFDSAVETPELAGVRGAATARLLTFEASTLSVEIEVSASGSRRRIVGQLVPGHVAVVEVLHDGGSEEVETDDIGRFAVDGIFPGPVRIDVRAADQPGPSVSTAWVIV